MGYRKFQELGAIVPRSMNTTWDMFSMVKYSVNVVVVVVVLVPTAGEVGGDEERSAAAPGTRVIKTDWHCDIPPARTTCNTPHWPPVNPANITTLGHLSLWPLKFVTSHNSHLSFLLFVEILMLFIKWFKVWYCRYLTCWETFSEWLVYMLKHMKWHLDFDNPWGIVTKWFVVLTLLFSCDYSVSALDWTLVEMWMRFIFPSDHQTTVPMPGWDAREGPVSPDKTAWT